MVDAAVGDDIEQERPKRQGMQGRSNTAHPVQRGLTMPLCCVVRNWKEADNRVSGDGACRDDHADGNTERDGREGSEAARQRHMSLPCVLCRH
jgi:hypothetical protein